MTDLYGKTRKEIEDELFGKPLSDSQIIEIQNNKISEQSRQNAILQDRLKFASDQADLFAKVLKNVDYYLDGWIDDFDEYPAFVESATQLKNSIPENALKRAE